MELENIKGYSFDVLQREILAARRGNPSCALFARVRAVAGAMEAPALRTKQELKRLLYPYTRIEESLREAVAAWAVEVLIPNGRVIMQPKRAASLITASVVDTEPHSRLLPACATYAAWLRIAREQHDSTEWPEVAARWFVEMVYPLRRKKLGVYRAAEILGKECA